jgi:hypothetical protein
MKRLFVFVAGSSCKFQTSQRAIKRLLAIFNPISQFFMGFVEAANNQVAMM